MTDLNVSHEQLKKWHRDLDACQKVIWLSGCRPQVPGGFDPAYCTDAQASLKEIEAVMAAPPLIDNNMLLGLLELMAGVCEKAQWLLDQTSPDQASDAEQALADALEACNDIPPIDDANERDGWLTVYDRIRELIQ